jgi:parvulin-like peptidyl-prolyl isomerase
VIRRLAIIGLLLLPLVVFVGCANGLPDGAIAQVGTAVVTQDQFSQLSAAYQAAGKAPSKASDPQGFKRFQQGLAEYLVIQQVLQQEASSFGVTVTDADVQNKLNQVKQMFQGDQDKFQAALKKQNLTLEQLTESIRQDLWLERMKDAVTGNVSITDAEAQDYYNAHKSEYVAQESRQVKHILISPFATLADGTVSTTATQEEWEQAKSQAEKVRSEIQNGADFASEAEKYSDDATTKDSGGDLGAVTRGTMAPEFEEAVFALQKDELSQPVKTQYGYHLIVVTDITPAQQLGYDQVRETIKTTLLSQKQSDTWNAWLAAKEAELGVVYRAGYAPAAKSTVTTQRAAKTTTTASGATTTSAAKTTATSG